MAPPPRSSTRSLPQRAAGRSAHSPTRPLMAEPRSAIEVFGLVDVVERASARIERRSTSARRSRRSGAPAAASGAIARPRASNELGGVARGSRPQHEARQGPEPVAVLPSATASTPASPATRSISSRTAVERSGMSPPATNASSVDAASRPAQQSRERALALDRTSRTNRMVRAGWHRRLRTVRRDDHEDLRAHLAQTRGQHDAGAGPVDGARRACRCRTGSSALPRARSRSRPRSSGSD